MSLPYAGFLASRTSFESTLSLVVIFFLTSILSDRFLKGLIVEQDAAATASHILTHQSFFAWALQVV